MRYRWDPAYPMGRRDTQAYDAPACGPRTTSATPWRTSSRATMPRAGSMRSSSRTASTPPCRPPPGAISTGCSTTCRASQRADTPSTATPPDPPVGVRGGLRGHRRRGDHALLPDVPRAVAPRRRHRAVPLAASRGEPARAPSPTASSGIPARSWTTEPSPCPPVNPPRMATPAPSLPLQTRAFRPWSSSLALQGTNLRRSRRGAQRPPLTRVRWSRRRTFRSACRHVNATSSSAIKLPRRTPPSGCWLGATRGRSTRCSTSCARPSPSWRSRPSGCSRSAGESFLKIPERHRSSPGVSWRVPPVQRTGWPSRCSMRSPIWPIPRGAEAVSCGPVRLTLFPLTPAGGRVECP